MGTWQKSKPTQRANLKLGLQLIAHPSLNRHLDLDLSQSHLLDLSQSLNLALSPNVSFAKTRKRRKTLLFKSMPRSRPRIMEKLRLKG